MCSEARQNALRRRDLAVHLLDNNAGFAVYDHFEKIDPEQVSQMMVNVSAVVDMAHAFLPDMVARGEGAVITVSSPRAFRPERTSRCMLKASPLPFLLVRHSGPNIESAV